MHAVRLGASVNAAAPNRPGRLCLITGFSCRVLGSQPMAVFAAGHMVDPGLVRQVPLDRLAYTCLERFLGLPPQFSFQLAGIDCIPPVMAWAIFDERDLLAVTLRICPGFEFIQYATKDID